MWSIIAFLSFFKIKDKNVDTDKECGPISHFKSFLQCNIHSALKSSEITQKSIYWIFVFLISRLSVSGSGPSLSDLSLLAGRRSGEGGIPGGLLGSHTPTSNSAELHAAAAAAYSRLTSPYMDPLYTGLHTSPTGSLRLSPIDSRGKIESISCIF